MEYIYFIENISNKNITHTELDTNIVYILCYHINTTGKYPFLQFMMEKIPFCDHLVKEEFVLPYINILNNRQNIAELALEKISHNLRSIGCDCHNLNEDMYKGVILTNNTNTSYLLINISDIKLDELLLSRNSNYWFILTTEIINTQSVCNIGINSEVTHLFTNNPTLGILTNPNTKINYILPDTVYTTGDFKSVEFDSIFGNKKTKHFDTCGEYFYFYRTFIDSIKAIKDDNGHKPGEHGINRYALFVEGKIYLETESEFSLTDDIIEKMYPEPCITICYTNVNISPKKDILAKDRDCFVSMSYHKLDMIYF